MHTELSYVVVIISAKLLQIIAIHNKFVAPYDPPGYGEYPHTHLLNSREMRAPIHVQCMHVYMIKTNTPWSSCETTNLFALSDNVPRLTHMH